MKSKYLALISVGSAAIVLGLLFTNAATVTGGSTVLACTTNPSGVTVGAIRFDGWYGGGSGPHAWNVNKVLTTSLSPSQFWYRIPFFGEILYGALQTIDGGTTAVMSNEIAYAQRAGIDYWAFLDFPPNTGPDAAISLYLNANSSAVKFSLILNSLSYDQAISNDYSDQSTYLPTLISRILDPRFQTVLNGRPLIYVYDDICNAQYINKYCSPWLFDYLTQKVVG